LQVAFKNWYYQRRTFQLRSSRPQLVKFTSPSLEIPGQQERNLGIQIDARGATAGLKDVLVFVNDSEDRNEDCYKIQIILYEP
jgi:hypothetical protein